MDDNNLKWFYIAMIGLGISVSIGAGLEQYYAHVEKMEMIKAGILPEKEIHE